MGVNCKVLKELNPSTAIFNFLVFLGPFRFPGKTKELLSNRSKIIETDSTTLKIGKKLQQSSNWWWLSGGGRGVEGELVVGLCLSFSSPLNLSLRVWKIRHNCSLLDVKVIFLPYPCITNTGSVELANRSKQLSIPFLA